MSATITPRKQNTFKKGEDIMRYKKENDNRYRVNFMIATEKLMDQLTVKEFISYLEENAEFEDESWKITRKLRRYRDEHS